MSYKFIILLFSFALLVNCENSDNYVCSCVAKEFSVEIVNVGGENLIENGTYDFDAIQINSQGRELFLDPERTQKELIFQVIREDGDTAYTIDLNGTEIDTLVLNVSLDNDTEKCCPSDVINSASYNGQDQEILDNNPVLPAKITIVKP